MFLCSGHYHMQLTAGKYWCSKDLGEKGTCFLTLAYVCRLDKNARQHMQKLCRNIIHMVIPLYLNNFLSGAGLNARLGKFEHLHALSSSMTIFYCDVHFFLSKKTTLSGLHNADAAAWVFPCVTNRNVKRFLIFCLMNITSNIVSVTSLILPLSQNF